MTINHAMENLFEKLANMEEERSFWEQEVNYYEGTDEEGYGTFELSCVKGEIQNVKWALDSMDTDWLDKFTEWRGY